MRWHSGDTLIEVTVALAILATVLSSGYALINLSSRVGQTAKERTQAIDYAQEQAEALRSYRDKNQTSFSVFDFAPFTGTFHMESLAGAWTPKPGSYIPSSFYTIQVTRVALTATPVQKYRFTVAVTWASILGGTPTNQSTIITDLANIGGLVPCDNSVSGSCL
jgi:type II secretory pathway pseudopilin PulG